MGGDVLVGVGLPAEVFLLSPLYVCPSGVRDVPVFVL